MVIAFNSSQVRLEECDNSAIAPNRTISIPHRYDYRNRSTYALPAYQTFQFLTGTIIGKLIAQGISRVIEFQFLTGTIIGDWLRSKNYSLPLFQFLTGTIIGILNTPHLKEPDKFQFLTGTIIGSALVSG